MRFLFGKYYSSFGELVPAPYAYRTVDFEAKFLNNYSTEIRSKLIFG